MSEAKHTPGPWRQYNPDGRAIWSDRRGIGERAIAKVYGPTTRECMETFANARLIAAAPELLEAARKKLADCRDYGECNDAALMPGEYCSTECADLARSIAKAEGR